MRPLLLGAAFANVLLVLFNIAIGASFLYILMNVICAVLCYVGYINTFGGD
tara:strand:+ start:74 stop:226 length:153 start_codon:yes stop_codon:yes gene_type:complete